MVPASQRVVNPLHLAVVAVCRRHAALSLIKHSVCQIANSLCDPKSKHKCDWSATWRATGASQTSLNVTLNIKMTICPKPWSVAHYEMLMVTEQCLYWWTPLSKLLPNPVDFKPSRFPCHKPLEMLTFSIGRRIAYYFPKFSRSQYAGVEMCLRLHSVFPLSTLPLHRGGVTNLGKREAETRKHHYGDFSVCVCVCVETALSKQVRHVRWE